MKKLVGFLAGLCACCLVFGGITLSWEHYTARAETVEGESVEAVEAPTAVGATTNLTVHLEWTDDNNTTHPCQYIDFEVLPSNVFGRYHTTDENGICELSNFLERDKEYNISIIVYAGGDDVIVKNSKHITYFDEIVYSVEIGVHREVPRNFTMDTDFGQAMQISQAAIIGARYAEAMNGGNDIADVSIVYPSIGDTICYYSRSNKTIYIRPAEENQTLKSYASWDVILHEYGHHVQYIFGITESPCETHYANWNCIDLLGGAYNKVLQDRDPDFKGYDDLQHKEHGVKLAWGEGWPTFFSLAAQQFYAAELRNIDTVGDGRYDAHNGVHQDYETSRYILGEGSEDAIIQVLYRMYDEDGLNLGHKNMWDYVMNSKAVTFSQFAKYIYDNQLVGINEFGTLLAASGFAPTDFSIEPDRADQIPTFVWVGTGGSTVCPYNYFTLYFYDRNGSELPCRISRSITVENGAYHLEFNASYWNKLLQSSGSYYYLRIEAMQKGDYTTGPYSSPKMRMEKPYTDFWVSYGNEVTNKELTQPNECAWFRYVAPSRDVYQFKFNLGNEPWGSNKQFTLIVFPYMTYSIGNGRLFTATDSEIVYECQLEEGQELYFCASINNGQTGRICARVYRRFLNLSSLNAGMDTQRTLCPLAELGEVARFRLLP